MQKPNKCQGFNKDGKKCGAYSIDYCYAHLDQDPNYNKKILNVYNSSKKIISKNKNKYKKWILGIGVISGLIIFISGFLQYKIIQYNSELELINERINGKVTSGLFLNSRYLQESVSFVVLNQTIFRDNLEKKKEIEDQIIKRRVEIIGDILNLGGLPINFLAARIKNIIDDTELSFDKKFDELLAISNEYDKKIGIYLDKQYDKRNKVNNNLSMSHLIQVYLLLILFITSSMVSILTFKNDKAE